MSLRSLMAVLGVMAALMPGMGSAASDNSACTDVSSDCQLAAAVEPVAASNRDAAKPAREAAATERQPPAVTKASFDRRAKYRELGWRMIENLGGPGGIFTLR